MNLFTHELIHLALSIIAGLIAWSIFTYRYKKKFSGRDGFMFLLGGAVGDFFLDVDHLVDYVIAFGLHFNLSDFLSGAMFGKLQKTFVPLHGWEWVALLTVITIFVKNKTLKYFLLAVTLGIFLHLVYDTRYNHFQVLGYSLIYRLIHQFDLKSAVVAP